MIINTLREVILDHQELEQPTGVPRRTHISTLPNKATLCIGVRRCGKSTFMSQLMRGLTEAGVSRQNILHINFFDDRLRPLQHTDLGVILEAYFSLFPHKKGVEKIYCFFDEIQVIPNWEPFIDRLMRTELCEVYITGSSAQLLSRELATQMRGRALSWEMFPFSFREHLDAHGIKSDGPLSTKQRLTIQKAFEGYWERGGFPEVTHLSAPLRVKVHQEYMNAMLFRDIIERHDVSHPRAITDLASWLINNVASLYSINNLTGYLKSLGHKTPKSSVSDYLEWFEDAYILFTVRLFDPSITRAQNNPKKIYCIDHALVTSTSTGILTNAGHLLENLIFTALRRTTSEIFYYKTRGGREVDFITQRPGEARQLVQVCESMQPPTTRARELSALTEAMGELGLRRGVVVTRAEEEVVEGEWGTIEVVPAWRFLLGGDAGSLT